MFLVSMPVITIISTLTIHNSNLG